MLHFKVIRYQNFLSTGNQWTEIALDQHASTLIVGENGAGKSTILDALSFALYGRPYRDINKPLLMNSITRKNLLVEIEFSHNARQYKVVRGIKPNVFEIYCDDKLVDQNANVREYQDHLEKNVLKMNHKSFCQIVVIGSANFTPFMQLKPQERREIIEDLLDIQIFSKMLALLKEKMQTNKDNIIRGKQLIAMQDEMIEMKMKHMRQIQEIKKNDSEFRQRRIDSSQAKILELRDEIINHNKEIDKLNEQISDLSSVKNNISKLKKYEIQINQRVTYLKNEISFLSNNEDCPTCKQSIGEDFREQTIEDHQKKSNEIAQGLDKLREEYARQEERLLEIEEIQTKISAINIDVLTKNSQIATYQKTIDDLQKERQDEQAVNGVCSFDEIEELRAKQTENKTKYEEYLRQKAIYDQAAILLKDGGIKTRIIKQYIPVINKLMNKYLAAMDFFVQFELDEQFNEKIKSRFRDEFVYSSFSEGEKMRLDLSLLFTWRTVSKLRNSMTTNLLIMDEIFDSSLDTNGTDEFLKILMQMDAGTNVFVISHKGDQLYDKFQNVIRFEKVKNFSQIAA